MNKKKKSPVPPSTGLVVQSNQDHKHNAADKVSKTSSPTGGLPLNFSCCFGCNRIGVEGIGYYVLKRGGAIVRRAICRKCVEDQIPNIGYPTNGHLALWLKARLRGRHYCEPCCAGCGSTALAASFGFYDYWPEQPRTLAETAFFDLCHACVTALSAASIEAERLRVTLAVNGFLVARQKSLDRAQEGLESMLQHPPRGSAKS